MEQIFSVKGQAACTRPTHIRGKMRVNRELRRKHRKYRLLSRSLHLPPSHLHMCEDQMIQLLVHSYSVTVVDILQRRTNVYSGCLYNFSSSSLWRKKKLVSMFVGRSATQELFLMCRRYPTCFVICVYTPKVPEYNND